MSQFKIKNLKITSAVLIIVGILTFFARNLKFYQYEVSFINGQNFIAKDSLKMLSWSCQNIDKFNMSACSWAPILDYLVIALSILFILSGIIIFIFIKRKK